MGETDRMKYNMINLDIDHIKSLRASGNNIEADKLIEAWQHCFKKNMKDGKKVNNQRYNRINARKWRKKKKHLNSSCVLNKNEVVNYANNK